MRIFVFSVKDFIWLDYCIYRILSINEKTVLKGFRPLIGPDTCQDGEVRKINRDEKDE